MNTRIVPNGSPRSAHLDDATLESVRAFRRRCIDNGHRAVRVRSGLKMPVGKQWEQGEAKEQLLAIETGALNSGILAAGLRCFDVDVDDPAIADSIEKLIRQRLPDAIVRRRAIHQGL